MTVAQRGTRGATEVAFANEDRERRGASKLFERNAFEPDLRATEKSAQIHPLLRALQAHFLLPSLQMNMYDRALLEEVEEVEVKTSRQTNFRKMVIGVAVLGLAAGGIAGYVGCSASEH